MYGLGYVQTQPGVSDHEIIAIDCEMVSFSKFIDVVNIYVECVKRIIKAIDFNLNFCYLYNKCPY